MPRILSDAEIAMLVQEKKPLPSDWRSRMVPRPNQGDHLRSSALDIVGERSHAFRLIARENNLPLQDFSVILLFTDSDGETYVLRRNNGEHNSKHTNRWEKDRGLPNAVIERRMFHRHFATERYQLSGYPIDGYAEATTDYHDFSSAVGDLLANCGFERPIGESPGAGVGGA